jgi:hypothetical protein
MDVQAPGGMHRSNCVLFDHLVGLTSIAGGWIRHRRRLFSPRVLVKHAQHGERHGLNTCACSKTHKCRKYRRFSAMSS